MPKLVFKDAAGANQELDLDVTMYRAAREHFMTVPQYLQLRYPTDPQKYGSTFQQLMVQCGMYLRADPANGIRPPSLETVFNGRADVNAGVIVRDAEPASRILFPAVVLEAMENALQADNTGYVATFNRLVAIDDAINGNRFEQPILNYGSEANSPPNMRSRPVSQLNMPPAMISLTASDVARAIPTFALGMEISDEALKASTLDLVTLALTRQAEIERAARVDEYIQAFHGGDADVGQSALVATNASTLDSASTGGALTQLAWMKFLRRNFKKRRIDWVFCDLATAMKIETRTNKPTVQGDDPTSTRIDAQGTVANPEWQNVRIFMLEDGVITAGHILGIDSRYAIRRVRNIQADYAATEQFVLKKSQALRFDFGEIAYRLFDDAWDLLNLA